MSAKRCDICEKERASVKPYRTRKGYIKLVCFACRMGDP